MSTTTYKAAKRGRFKKTKKLPSFPVSEINRLGRKSQLGLGEQADFITAETANTTPHNALACTCAYLNQYGRYADLDDEQLEAFWKDTINWDEPDPELGQIKRKTKKPTIKALAKLRKDIEKAFNKKKSTNAL